MGGDKEGDGIKDNQANITEKVTIHEKPKNEWEGTIQVKCGGKWRQAEKTECAKVLRQEGSSVELKEDQWG